MIIDYDGENVISNEIFKLVSVHLPTLNLPVNNNYLVVQSIKSSTNLILDYDMMIQQANNEQVPIMDWITLVILKIKHIKAMHIITILQMVLAVLERHLYISTL